MNILAIDTCSAACSVALQAGGDLAERHSLNPRGHARLVLKMVDELLAEASLGPDRLDVVACTRGPGAFTGVRIGVAVTQGIALAADVPVVAVSSLSTLAQSVIGEPGVDGIAVAMDARMGEIYWCVFRKQNEWPVAVEPERVCPPTAVGALGDGSWLGVGDGWQTYREELTGAVRRTVRIRDDQLYPRASAVLPLANRALARGECSPAGEALPVYLRDRVVEKSPPG